jgi:hypothetical protein
MVGRGGLPVPLFARLAIHRQFGDAASFDRPVPFELDFFAPDPKTFAAFMSSFLQNLLVAFECVLDVAGLVYVGRLCFGAAGRAARARPAALPAWEVSLTDFLFLGWLVLSFMVLGQLLLQATVGPMLQRQLEGGTFVLLLSGSMFDFGAAATWLGARAFARRFRPAALRPCAPVTPEGLRQLFRDGLLTFLAVLPLATGVGLIWERLLQTLGLPAERQEIIDLILRSKSPTLLGFVIGLALVVAPIGEELVFRVGIFGFLRTRTPRWVAFGVSAGLFALLHLNWMSALPLFILGLVFAISYERTGRMEVPMLAHAFFNLNSLLLVLSGVGN